jgi:hypothetical protein
MKMNGNGLNCVDRFFFRRQIFKFGRKKKSLTLSCFTQKQKMPPPPNNQVDASVARYPIVDTLLSAKHNVVDSLLREGSVSVNVFSSVISTEAINELERDGIITRAGGIVSLKNAKALPPAPRSDDINAACACILTILTLDTVPTPCQLGILGSRVKAGGGFTKCTRNRAIDKLIQQGLISRRNESDGEYFTKVHSNAPVVPSQTAPAVTEKSNSAAPSPAAISSETTQHDEPSIVSTTKSHNDDEDCATKNDNSNNNQLTEILKLTRTLQERLSQFSGDHDLEEFKKKFEQNQQELLQLRIEKQRQQISHASERKNLMRAREDEIKRADELRQKLSNTEKSAAAEIRRLRSELRDVIQANSELGEETVFLRQRLDHVEKENNTFAVENNELKMKLISTIRGSDAAIADGASVRQAALSQEFASIACLATAMFDQNKIKPESRVKRDFATSRLRMNPCLETGTAEVLKKFLVPSTCMSFFKDPSTCSELDTDNFELLFHCTSSAAAPQILCQGHDPSFRGQHGQVLGPGEYFSREISLAANYGEVCLVVLVMKTNHFKNDTCGGIHCAIVDNCLCKKSTFCLPIGYATLDNTTIRSCHRCGPLSTKNNDSSASTSVFSRFFQAILGTTPASSPAPALPTSSFSSVQFQDDKSNWVSWSASEAAPILAKLNAGQTTSPLQGVSTSQFNYTIDFQAMTQTNEHTNKVRKIRFV